MYWLRREGVAIYFEDIGKGSPPLVFLHDLGADHCSFVPQIEHFRHNHRVVAVDLRGHGQSDKHGSGYSVSSLAGDICWLSYELGLYAPVIVGHGLGGMIGIELAARYPDLPAAVVALDPLGRRSLDWNAEAAMAACRVPIILYVDAGTGAADLGRRAELCTRVTVEGAAGSGPFPHVQYPHRINALIDAFLARLAHPAEEAESNTVRPQDG